MGKKALKYFWAFVIYSIVGLLENAIFGWVGERIADAIGITSPNGIDVIEAAWAYGLPAVTTFALLGGYHWWYSRYGAEKASGPIGDTLSATATIADAPFELSAWVNHGSYFVWAAACLWVNLKPIPKINEDHPAYPSLQKIKGAIDSGQIESLDGSSGMTTKVRREELLKLAYIHNDSPKFLFPDQDKRSFEKGYLREAFRKNRTRQSAISLLTHLRDEGVEMRNNVPLYLYPSDFEGWEAKIIEWMNEVAKVLKPVSQDDSTWFMTLDAVPPARVPIPTIRLGSQEDRERFVAIFKQHDYRVARLEKLLLKYGVGA